MNQFLVIFQFEPPLPKPWSKNQITSYMNRMNATYVSRGVYILVTENTAAEIRDLIFEKAELSDKDFLGVFPIKEKWEVTGHSKRGFTETVWPEENP